MFASSCTTRPRFSSRNSFYSLTGVSARLLYKGCDAHVRRYLWGTVWSGSYFAGSFGGASCRREAVHRDPQAHCGLSRSRRPRSRDAGQGSPEMASLPA